MFTESSNSSSIEKLSPIKKPPPTDQNDNTDEDVKSDLKSNKNDHESSLEDIETDENVSCGDSLPSTDLSVKKILYTNVEIALNNFICGLLLNLFMVINRTWKLLHKKKKKQ